MILSAQLWMLMIMQGIFTSVIMNFIKWTKINNNEVHDSFNSNRNNSGKYYCTVFSYYKLIAS